MAKAKPKVSPDVCSYEADGGKPTLNIEITIPGVDKKDIELKIQQESLYLRARRENFDYATALAFCCPVIPEQAKARYEHGLLKIEIPYEKPLEHLVKVEVE
jgi:HSP20 family protein